MFCNNCGNELPENAKFCNKCGTAVKIAENKTCLNCGNELPKGAAFCNICGAKCGVSPFDKLMPTEEMEFCCKRGLGVLALKHILQQNLIFKRLLKQVMLNLSISLPVCSMEE